MLRKFLKLLRRLIINLIGRRTLEIFFANHKWCRRLLGGRWEQWFVECCSQPIWYHIYPSTPRYLGRPSMQCRGTPIVEDYGWKD